jgi:hypothetical protein
MKNKFNWQACVFPLVFLVVCIAGFFLTSALDLPSAWVNVFSRFGWAHFLLTVALLYLIFQVKGKTGLLLGGLFSALVFALPLAVRFSTGLSNATVLAGFLPYKDGFYYYNGANMLLSGQLIPANGLQGAFRPLFPALLASLLWLTGGNLLLTLQFMVLATGLSVYLAALAVHRLYGPLPAAVFFALTFAFIRPMLGDTLTELPGLAFACLALVLLLQAGRSRNTLHAALGGVMLVLALSIRAGAFFMLPFVILWWGWLHLGDKWLPWKKMVILGLILVAAFVAFNTLLPHALVAPGESTFGNFSWMLYGQAVGGAGFKYHAEALGTSDSAVVLQAALEKIRTYPQGFLIGCYKAFRDFFSNNSLGMFDLLTGEKAIGGWFFWGACLVLLLSGLVRTFRQRKQPADLLLLVGFLGVLFSIPFLPPIDGGNRFYAGSAPFLFALLGAALPAAYIAQTEAASQDGMGQNAAWLSVGMLVLTALLPLGILAFSSTPTTTLPPCADGQIAFTTRVEKGAYVDIFADESGSCGATPELCRARFAANGMDQANDDFYRMLVDLSAQSDGGLRLWAGVEQNTSEYYFWTAPLDLTTKLSDGVTLSGCAQEIDSQFQRLLVVQSLSQPVNPQ